MTRSHAEVPGPDPPCGRIHRRTFLADVGLGFTGLALGVDARTATACSGPRSLWHRCRLDPTAGRTSRRKTKSVIWIFLSGGVSHLETWDPKPILNKYAGKTYDATGLPSPFKSPLFQERSRAVVGDDRTHAQIFPLQVGFKKHGEAGVEISDWWPHLATCVDDIAFVRSMYTTDNDHAAEFQMHHGRHKLDERQPVIGSWIHYGLGTLNENLPQFVFLGQYKDPRVRENFAADYLGPQYAGVELSLDPTNPLPFGTRSKEVLAEEQANEFAFIRDLNGLSAVEYPEDDQLRARIKAYELAFRMQQSVPEVVDLASESHGDAERSTGSTRRRRRSTAAACSPPAAWSSVGSGSSWSISAITASGIRTPSSGTCTPGPVRGSTGRSPVCSRT